MNSCMWLYFAVYFLLRFMGIRASATSTMYNLQYLKGRVDSTFGMFTINKPCCNNKRKSNYFYLIARVVFALS